jgi:outer membrane protein W
MGYFRLNKFNEQFLHWFLPAILIIVFLAPSPAWAQDSPDDFRIHKPSFFIGGHVGARFPRAKSDLFRMVTRELTLEKNDFRAPVFGFDLGIPFHSHFSAAISFEYGRSSSPSETRDYVEINGDPINQTTQFSQMPITATLRFYPIKQGETVGNYAWIPKRILPYIGAGGGFVRYSFSQSGRFVDSQTLNIFSTNLVSNGFVLTKHVSTGIDINISPLIFVNLEGNYSWAKANLSRDFTGFKPIDLTGFRTIAGIYFRF